MLVLGFLPPKMKASDWIVEPMVTVCVPFGNVGLFNY